MFSKRAVGVSIHFNNMYINRIYSKSHFLNLKTAKKINAILACLLTAGSSVEAFSSYFYHACEQIIAVIGVNRINSCKEIINTC